MKSCPLGFYGHDHNRECYQCPPGGHLLDSNKSSLQTMSVAFTSLYNLITGCLKCEDGEKCLKCEKDLRLSSTNICVSPDKKKCRQGMHSSHQPLHPKWSIYFIMNLFFLLHELHQGSMDEGLIVRNFISNLLQLIPYSLHCIRSCSFPC